MRIEAKEAVLREFRHYVKVVAVVIGCFYLPLLAITVFIQFPRDTDATVRPPKRRAQDFYGASYSRNSTSRKGLDYEKEARAAAVKWDVEGTIRRFVKLYHLEHKRVLEVGSGRGYLQDVVADYTGLDLSPTVVDRYHKPIVVASATSMPFPDNSFDAIWSIWVLEHIPEPEKALKEMRRVLKPGGILFLAPAWNCVPWAADGFDLRPYSDFNWRGKLVKSSLWIRRYSTVFYAPPIRYIRKLQYAISGASMTLHYKRLDPNYDIYWQPDSDAAVSLDRGEVGLWLQARGDQCLNCSVETDDEMIVRIRK